MSANKKDFPQCCKSVWSSLNGKCSRKGRYEEGVKHYCKQHHPQTIRDKREKEREEIRERIARRNRNNAIFSHKSKTFDIVKCIAEGHNDPRTLCCEFLEELKDIEEADYHAK